jgi:two-component system, OmpR family, sensor histidine kinase MtrB
VRTRGAGLGVRWTAAFALVAAFSSIAISGLSYGMVRASWLDRAVETRSREAILIVDEASAEQRLGPDPTSVRRSIRRIRSPFSYDVAVRDATGSTSGPASLVDAALAVEGGTIRSWREGAVVVEEPDEPWVGVAVPVEEVDATAYFRFPLGALVDDLELLRSSLAGAALTAVFLSAGVGWLASRSLLRPLHRARLAVQRLEQGRLDSRLPEEGRGEFADLARAFNAMADALERTVRDLQAMEADQRRFVSDVSHELRTPLTTLLAAGGALESNASTLSAGAARAARLLIEETRRLVRLVDDLMEISRMDSGGAAMLWERMDVAACVQGTIERHGWSDRVSLTSSGTAVMDADPRRLAAVCRNLIDNALVHGEPPVVVSVTGEDHRIRIEVQDSGPGVPRSSADDVFRRFFKADAARGGGSGLGLAIVRENARLHGGEIVVTRSSLGGARFTCSLPRSPEAVSAS